MNEHVIQTLCAAVQYSDRMRCAKCDQSWDVNDAEPPACKSPRTPAYLLDPATGKKEPLIIQRKESGTTDELLQERGRTHGDWEEQATMGNALKELMRLGKNWDSLSPYQKEALDMHQTKISRILTGNPDEPDHWDDIAGYARLVSKRLQQ